MGNLTLLAFGGLAALAAVSAERDRAFDTGTDDDIKAAHARLRAAFQKVFGQSYSVELERRAFRPWWQS